MRILPIISFVCISTAAAAQQASIVQLHAEKLHARVREWPYPVNGVTIPPGEPVLLWPATNGTGMVLPMESGSEVAEDPNIGKVRYKIMLARDTAFTKDAVAGKAQRWAVYPLHRQLAPGKWYWKYGYAMAGSDRWTWSPVYDFVVGAGDGGIVSPPAEAVLKKNGGPHPRLWNMHRIGEEFYRNNLGNPEARQFIRHAEKLMKEPLPVEKPRRIIDTTGKTELQKKKIIERMYHGFGDAVGTPVRNLCIAYQLTKDERFIQDAKRRALVIAAMDPDGLATRDDFTSGAVLEALGWCYDAAYRFLSPEEKALLLKVIRLRAKRVYDHLPNRFELHVSDNHVWQITLRNLAIATVAVIGELPEAAEWFTYMYEVWSARFPALGTTDGGWHEGNGYFRVNFKSIIYLSQLFGDFSGVDYFTLPWMKNLPYYMMYTHPAGAPTTAIGDMWENVPYIVKAEAWFAEALALKAGNPWFNTYVKDIRSMHPDYFNGTDDYLLFRLLNYRPGRQLPARALASLPQGRLFADAGVAAMHADLGNAANTLSSYLLSSPFGASGHGHASQNAFTVNFRGKVLFGGSGYYSNFSDRHNLLYYRTSKAYCTILADSLSQRIGEEGYGWIPRFISGQNIQYALGDASNAYGEVRSSFWLNRFEQINLQPSVANGYGDAGVTLYRRHMLQLNGGFIVLYDELEARKPVKWTTQFHAPYYPIQAVNSARADERHFALQTGLGSVTAGVFAASPLNMAVHTKFAEPAVNWNMVTNDEGKIKEFTDQWHAGITSGPAKKFRFLTIIQVKDGAPAGVVVTSRQNGLLHIRAGDWELRAQLNGELPAALQVRNAGLQSLFNYGPLPVNFRGAPHSPATAGNSMLLEMIAGKMKRTEVADEVPDVVKYDKEP